MCYAVKKARWLLFATCLGAASAGAEPMEFSPSLRLKGFVDMPAQGEISNDLRFSILGGRVPGGADGFQSTRS